MNNCNNCDNKTDGKCCHEAIRLKTEVIGSERSIKREFEIIESRQARQQKHQPLHGILVDLPKEI